MFLTMADEGFISSTVVCVFLELPLQKPSGQGYGFILVRGDSTLAEGL